MDPVVARLHRCLVDAIRQRGEDPESRPFKVSEIYQDLIPYREVRSALGVELNADYEHALLRLLAGEGDLLRLEPEAARVELRQEVESPYPFVGMYRKFAINAVFVRAGEHAAAPPEERSSRSESAREAVTRSPVPRAAARDPTGGATGSGRTTAPPDGAGTASRHGQPGAASEPVGHTEQRRSADERVVSTPVECAFCDQTLPVGRRIRYCPWCGSDHRLRPCPRCDEVLERIWRFCVNCGLKVPMLPSPRPPDPDE